MLLAVTILGSDIGNVFALQYYTGQKKLKIMDFYPLPIGYGDTDVSLSVCVCVLHACVCRFHYRHMILTCPRCVFWGEGPSMKVKEGCG